MLRKFVIAIVAIFLTTSVAHSQLLYRISGNGLQRPSYIFGTHHLAPTSIVDSISSIEQALASVSQVYGELDMREMMKPESLKMLQERMTLPEGVTISSLLTPDQFSRLNSALHDNLGIDMNNEAIAAQFDRLSPFALANSLPLIAFVANGNAAPTESLDAYFQNRALSAGKSVFGFETAQFQAEILYDTSIDEGIKALMCFVDNFSDGVDAMEMLTAAYMAQDIALLSDITEEELEAECGTSPEQQDALIYNRNANWVAEMPKIMKSAPTFFAVGAAHLIGEKGVLALLRNAGYTIDPLR